MKIVRRYRFFEHRERIQAVGGEAQFLNVREESKQHPEVRCWTTCLKVEGPYLPIPVAKQSSLSLLSSGGAAASAHTSGYEFASG